MQQLQTVDADTLLYEPIEKPSFVVDGLIPTGLSLFCGSQKIGKSWLMLKLCLCVSQGIPLWDMQTLEGDVLYLCLEDTFCRIQDRLFRLTDEASGRLHFAVASCKLPVTSYQTVLSCSLRTTLKHIQTAGSLSLTRCKKSVPHPKTMPMPTITGIYRC